MAIYEDFEPYCKWQRELARDTLEVHLQGFRKDQLKIQLNNVGVMLISGQRPLDENRSVWSRFRKEIKLPKDYNTNEIHAKLSGGILYIVMPKITSDIQAKTTTQAPENRENQRNKSTIPKNSPQEQTMKGSNGGFGLKDIVKNKRISDNVAVAIAVAIVIGAFAIYKYGHSS